MIDIHSAIPTILTKIKNLPANQYVEILTYKKDRSLKIVPIEKGDFLIIRKGFKQEHLQVPSDKLTKALKSLLKKEFPRSNKAHIKTGLHQQ